LEADEGRSATCLAEAIWRIEVEDFPAFIIIDDKGNDFFKELNLG
jgi:fumarate hydratase class I